MPNRPTDAARRAAWMAAFHAHLVSIRREMGEPAGWCISPYDHIVAESYYVLGKSAAYAACHYYMTREMQR